MGKTTGDIEQFLRELAEWASAREDILAVALIGSHARGEARKDSDVDLILLVENPEKYFTDEDWSAQFGTIRRRRTEPYGSVTSLRVWYGDGREVEYGIGSRQWAEEPLDEGTQRVIRDGMRILFERGTILSHHMNPPSRS
ncbi:MAG TPA: nucleotidyltransferase domain-containing protein [Anaerolineales bacterium]